MLLSEKISVLIFLSTIFFIYSCEARFLIAKLLGKKPGASVFQNIIHGLSILGVICFVYGYFVEPYWIEVRNVAIQTPKLKKTSFTIVQISDLHCDIKIRAERKLVKMINDIKPDVIVFTGDALNSPLAIDNLKNTLRDIHSNLGKFAVKGNWDVDFWNRADLFQGTGFIELNRTMESVEKNGEQLILSGIAAHTPVEGMVMPEDKFTIFLSHYPDFIESIAPVRVDLYLAGHTHGGQVALPFYGALITFSKFGKKYEAGKYKVNDTILYVNRGIGMEGGYAPRVRFFARPEITVFKISPSDKLSIN